MYVGGDQNQELVAIHPEDHTGPGGLHSQMVQWMKYTEKVAGKVLNNKLKPLSIANGSVLRTVARKPLGREKIDGINKTRPNKKALRDRLSKIKLCK